MTSLSVVMLAAFCISATQGLLHGGSIAMPRIDNRPDTHRLLFTPYLETFIQFKGDFGKTYSNEVEEVQKFSAFVSNMKQIEEHNLKFHNGQSPYFLGINQFSDMTHEEYLEYNRLGKYSKMADRSFTRCSTYSPRNSTPESIDWRTKGAVTPVKDQKHCGSCWTFSSTGAIEGQNFINTGRLLSFSKQQILDCCQESGCDGCTGGLMDPAFVYINSTGGLELESDYPYEAEVKSCRFQKSKIRVKVVGCADITSGDESVLQNAVGNVGPVSVAIDASHPSFKHYAGGVYHEPNCKNGINNISELDHAVLVVGYGTQGGQDYWIVKNSWGENIGVKGYILMSRNKNNQCGIATSASFPQTTSP